MGGHRLISIPAMPYFFQQSPISSYSHASLDNLPQLPSVVMPVPLVVLLAILMIVFILMIVISILVIMIVVSILVIVIVSLALATGGHPEGGTRGPLTMVRLTGALSPVETSHQNRHKISRLLLPRWYWRDLSCWIASKVQSTKGTRMTDHNPVVCVLIVLADEFNVL